MANYDPRLIKEGVEPADYENDCRILMLLDELAGVVAELEESMLYKVEFDSDGGSSVPTQYIKDGDKVVEPEDPTKEGYTFVEWVVGETAYDFDTPVESHLMLKATWEEEATE